MPGKRARVRCTYCREIKPSDEFSSQGDHVVPAALGGAWVDPMVCAECNRVAARAADELISKDMLVRFLRAMYEIPDRYGKCAPPPVFSVRLADGGVVKAILSEHGPRFQGGMPVDVADAVGLGADQDDQERLAQIVADALGGRDASDSLHLARAGQAGVTPPWAWSRFVAKVGLACGRDAYGDAWLDSRQARILSADVLGQGAPQFAQREHHPPVERAWPYVPPKHQLWIQPHENTAILMIALFGQVLGAVPVNDLPAEAAVSAWSFDPQERSFHRSTWPAIWLGNAAARATQTGADAITILDERHRPFVYIPDGPDGPVDFGVPLRRVQSFTEALAFARGEPTTEGAADPPAMSRDTA